MAKVDLSPDEAHPGKTMRKDISQLVRNDRQSSPAFDVRPDVRLRTEQSGKTMSELRMSLDCVFANGNSPQDGKPLSAPERELLEFIGAVDKLIVSSSTHFLTEIWLDELSRMDSMPGPTSSDWRLVSVAAAHRLVNLLLD